MYEARMPRNVQDTHVIQWELLHTSQELFQQSKEHIRSPNCLQ